MHGRRCRGGALSELTRAALIGAAPATVVLLRAALNREAALSGAALSRVVMLGGGAGEGRGTCKSGEGAAR